MKSMFFTSFGSRASRSSLLAKVPFSLICTLPSVIKGVTVRITSSTLRRGSDSLASRLYPSVDASRCASDGIINSPSTFFVTRAASTVTSFISTLFAVLSLSFSFCAPTGNTRKHSSSNHKPFLIVFVFCYKDRVQLLLGQKSTLTIS